MFNFVNYKHTNNDHLYAELGWIKLSVYRESNKLKNSTALLVMKSLHIYIKN